MELDTLETSHDIQQLLVLREQISNLHENLNLSEPRPRVDLFDFGEAFRLIMEVPGVAQDDLEVAIQGREVIVAGLREPNQDGKLLVSERPSGHFQRSIELPAEVEREASHAHLHQGLLILDLPKVETT